MITISEATVENIETIREIAYKSWPVAYGKILSPAQLDFMLEKFYSDVVLKDNLINQRHCFLLISVGDVCQGFASYEHHYLNENCTRLHKLYLLPETQGKGLGRLLLDKIEDLAKMNNSNVISLNVNRFNKAALFYKKMGFEIIGEEDIAIGNGYLMEDYKMEKRI